MARINYQPASTDKKINSDSFRLNNGYCLSVHLYFADLKTGKKNTLNKQGKF